MMMLAFAALAQAAQTPPAAAGAPAPAWRAAGRAWGDCVKGRIDARLQSAERPEALADAAMAGCTRELDAVRTAITAERGAEAAAANVERVRNGGRAMFIAYIASRRPAAAGTAQPSPAPTP